MNSTSSRLVIVTCALSPPSFPSRLRYAAAGPPTETAENAGVVCSIEPVNASAGHGLPKQLGASAPVERTVPRHRGYRSASRSDLGPIFLSAGRH